MLIIFVDLAAATEGDIANNSINEQCALSPSMCSMHL